MNGKSPYSASYTGAALMFSEMKAVIPHLLEDSSPTAVKAIVDSTEIVRIHSLKSRAKVVNEFVKRFHSMPETFWHRFLALPEDEQRLALFFVFLKTYRLAFDFHVNVAVAKADSADPRLESIDLLMELGEIAARDQFVDGWSESTKKMVVSKYLTMLRQVGMLDPHTDDLLRLPIGNDAYRYYVEIGEDWFLKACLLPPYEINSIKQSVI